MKSFKSALINMRRLPYQTLVVILMTSITFFVAYSFSLTVLGAHKVMTFFETQIPVIAFFEIDTDTAQVMEAKDLMEAKSYVKKAQVVTKEQALEIYKQDKEDNPLLLELVTADILPASIDVKAESIHDLAQIKTDLEQIQGIEQVEYQEDIANKLIRNNEFLRIGGLAFTSILAINSFLLIFVIIGFKAANKKVAIRIMRIIGATNMYISAPFFFEGVIYGILGSIFGWVWMFVAFLYLTPTLEGFFAHIIDFPINYMVYVYQLVIGTSVGVLLSAFASILAVRKLIKK